MLSPTLELLCKSLSCVTSRGDQHTHVLIEETDPLAKLRKVTLSAPTGDWFAFAPDKGRGRLAQMSPLLSTGAEHGHHRACDKVILICSENKVRIVYIDLKSGNPVGYSGQFKSTRQFVRYSLGLLEEFHSKKFEVVEERFVVLYGGKKPLLNKMPTVPKAEKIGRTAPDAAYKRELPDNAKLYLKELLG